LFKIVRVGDQRPGGKAAEFRYLLPPNENGAEKDDGGRANRTAGVAETLAPGPFEAAF